MEGESATFHEYRNLAHKLRKSAKALKNKAKRMVLRKTAEDDEEMALSAQLIQRMGQARTDGSTGPTDWARFVASELTLKAVTVDRS
jgi:hypothetical protein